MVLTIKICLEIMRIMMMMKMLKAFEKREGGGGSYHFTNKQQLREENPLCHHFIIVINDDNGICDKDNLGSNVIITKTELLIDDFFEIQSQPLLLGCQMLFSRDKSIESVETNP